MLPKSKRITTSLFDRIMKEGRNIPGQHLYARFAAVGANEATRLSVSVPKKVSKSAVRRNYNRRRVNAALIPHRNALLPGFIGVFFVKNELREVPAAQVTMEVEMILKKMGALR